MAGLDSEDSLDGTLVIDEPNYDCNTIEISDSNTNSDVEVVELDDDTAIIPSSLNHSSSLITSNITCEVCSKIFLSNNDLLNHVRKFKGRIGNCKIDTNVIYPTKRKSTEDLKPELLIKKKRGRPPKISTIIKPAVPLAIPLAVSRCPPLIPVIFKPIPPPSNSLPSLRQILVDEIEPEYTCPTCGESFRHNIGLICHLDSQHNDVTTNQVVNIKKKSQTKLKEKKNNVKKIKQTENNEPTAIEVDLTLLPDLKKDSLWNRIKSYVHSANKNKVICVLCKLEFQNTKKALAHVEDKHIMDKIQCGYCNMKFVYELKLRSHMAKRHKVIGVYKCDKCLKMINREEYESHSEKCIGIVNPVKIKKEKINLEA